MGQNAPVEYEDGVAIIRLNRPDTLNAISTALREDLRDSVQQVNGDDSVRVVILTGNGRSFCAGIDLSEPRPAGHSTRELLTEGFKPTLLAISEAPKPWISAVNGAAAGIGSAFAMACDLMVMAANSYLYQAFAAIGLIPDGGATWQLARTVGRKKAYELMTLGEKLSADKCLQLGLCNRVVAAEQLLDESLALARQLMDKAAPLSLRYAKQTLNVAMEQGLAEVIDREAELQDLCSNSEDAREGAQAFLEKRPAVFRGR